MTASGAMVGRRSLLAGTAALAAGAEQASLALVRRLLDLGVALSGREPEALRDLQATLTQGRPWAGLLKSRRPDGGFLDGVSGVVGHGHTSKASLMLSRAALSSSRRSLRD